MNIKIVGLPSNQSVSSFFGFDASSFKDFKQMASSSLGLARLSFSNTYPNKKFTKKVVRAMVVTQAVAIMNEDFKEKNVDFVKKANKIFPTKFQEKIKETMGVSSSYLKKRQTELYSVLENDNSLRKEQDLDR